MDAYYLTLFRKEGHIKWRAHLCADGDGFKREVVLKQGAKVVEQKVLRISATTAEIEIQT